MDFMELIINFMLFFTVAFFFGYPLGWIVGRRQMKNGFARKYSFHPLPEYVAEAQGRLDEKDILNAEIIEHKTEVQK